jgi:hypothetical protein
MGKDFLKVVELAIASGALVIPGYAAAGDTTVPEPKTASAEVKAPAPVVKSARLDKGGLTIQFSEPVRPTTGVDPNKFRLTFAYYSKGRPGAYAYYYEYYGAVRPLTVYSNVGRTALAARIEQPRPDQIRIPATAALSISAICEEISTAPAAQKSAGLYLHYAEPGGARVESKRGAALESIAPYWLTKDDTTVTRGALEGRPIPVTVSCH